MTTVERWRAMADKVLAGFDALNAEMDEKIAEFDDAGAAARLAIADRAWREFGEGLKKLLQDAELLLPPEHRQRWRDDMAPVVAMFERTVSQKLRGLH